MGGQSEMKDSAAADVGTGSDLPLVGFDDRLADGEPNAGAAASGREKGFKDTIHIFGIKSDAGVFHRHGDRVQIVLGRSDSHLPRFLGGFVHGRGGVGHEVQDHLLELNLIALDERQSVRQLKAYPDFLLGQLALHQGSHFANPLVEIHRNSQHRGILQEADNSPMMLTRPTRASCSRNRRDSSSAFRRPRRLASRSRRASTMRFCSVISMHEPIYPLKAPSASNRGTPESNIQRYSPSNRRKRYSIRNSWRASKA